MQLSRWWQLNKPLANRSALAYGYLGLLAAIVVVVNLTAIRSGIGRQDDLLVLAYLCLSAPLLNVPQVRIEQGHLSLVSIANQAAAILLSPLNATLVGVASAVTTARRGLWPLVANTVFSGCINLVGSFVAFAFWHHSGLGLPVRFLVVVACSVTNLVVVVIAFRIRTGEPIVSVARRTFKTPFFVAFGYSSLAAILNSYVLDGSLLGFLLSVIVCLLALALTDTIAGRRVRRVLESELSDADRHLFHSRAVEGVVHNLRNHMATAVGYLKEIDLENLKPVDREAVETATAAVNDAVTVLRTLSQGATPRVSYAKEPVDLNELVTRAMGMARPRAHTKTVVLALHETTDDVQVKADPLLLREVLTNLINNAIDAAPNNGHVVLSTGRRNNGWPYFSVADDGPGVAEENRHHLFEPHFTTKETGTGLGLFMSYGIVREHQGQLTYEGSRRGGVFTVALPPYPS